MEKMKSIITVGTLAVFATLFLFVGPGIIASGYTPTNAAPSLAAPGTAIHMTPLPQSGVTPAKAVDCAKGSGCAYVTDFDSDSVSVLQGSKVVTTVNCGGETGSAGYDPANKMVYVAVYATDSVCVINAATQKVVKTISTSGESFGVVYSTKSGMIYVTNFASAEVVVINPKTNKVVKDITTCGTYPEFIDQMNKGDVYVVSRGDSSGDGCINAINPTTNKVIKTADFTDDDTVGVAVNQANKEVYVSDEADYVLVLNSVTLKTVKTLSTDENWGDFYNAGAKTIFTDNFANAAVTPISTANKVGTPITLNSGDSEDNSGCAVGSTSYVPAYVYSVTSLVVKNKNTANPSTGTEPFSCAGT